MRSEIRGTVEYSFGAFSGYHLAEPFDTRALNVGHAAEFAQEFLGGVRTDAGNIA